MGFDPPRLHHPITVDTSEAGYPGRWRGGLTLAVLLLAYVASLVDRQMVALLIGPIKADFHVGDFRMSLLVGVAFALFYSVLGIPLGRLADRTDRTRMIAVGVALWSASTILCGFAGSFAALFVCRMLVGVGEATLAPAGLSLLSDIFPPHRLVRAATIFTSGATLGAGVALLGGGPLIDQLSHTRGTSLGLAGFAPWQATFIVVGAPGLIVAALVALSREPTRKGASGGSSAAALRHLWQQRRDYLPIYATASAMAIVGYGGLSWFPTHMIRTFGLTPGQAGLWLGSIQLAGALLGAVLAVALTERMLARGRADAHLRAVMLTSIGVALTMVAPLMPTVATTLAVWFVSTIFQNTYLGILAAALQLVTPNRARGTNAAVFTLAINLIGLALGSALIGAASQYVFPGTPRGAGYALGLVGAVAALTASTLARRGLPGYRRAAAAQLARLPSSATGR